MALQSKASTKPNDANTMATDAEISAFSSASSSVAKKVASAQNRPTKGRLTPQTTVPDDEGDDDDYNDLDLDDDDEDDDEIESPKPRSQLKNPRRSLDEDEDDEDEYDDDEDEDEGEGEGGLRSRNSRVVSPKRNKSKAPKVIVFLVLFAAVAAVGYFFALPAILGDGASGGAAVLVPTLQPVVVLVPQEFQTIGRSPQFAGRDLQLHDFIANSRSMARAGLQPGTAAMVTTNQASLERHMQGANTITQAFATPIVFVMRSSVANELMDLNIVYENPADRTMTVDVAQLMALIARGSDYDLVGPDLLHSDAGNTIWFMMNRAIQESAFDENVGFSILNNMRVSMLQGMMTEHIFRTLTDTYGANQIAMVPESLVIQDTAVNSYDWMATSQQSLVVVYPDLSTILPFHVLLYTPEGELWWSEIAMTPPELAFETWGLRGGDLVATPLNNTRLQAGLREEVRQCQVTPSMEQFRVLMNMLES